MTSCPNCYRDYPGNDDSCNECGHETKPVDAPKAKPVDVPEAQIIDLFEALKKALAKKDSQ